MIARVNDNIRLQDVLDEVDQLLEFTLHGEIVAVELSDKIKLITRQAIATILLVEELLLFLDEIESTLELVINHLDVRIGLSSLIDERNNHGEGVLTRQAGE